MALVDEITRFVEASFPNSGMQIDALGQGCATVRLVIGAHHLRPGGTVSGPTMMLLADAGIYITLMGELGMVTNAVTTNLTINFFLKPSSERDMIAECRLLKVGRAIVVGEVTLCSEGSSTPVAHAVVTYSLPPQSKPDQ